MYHEASKHAQILVDYLDQTIEDQELEVQAEVLAILTDEIRKRHVKVRDRLASDPDRIAKRKAEIEAARETLRRLIGSEEP